MEKRRALSPGYAVFPLLLLLLITACSDSDEPTNEAAPGIQSEGNPVENPAQDPVVNPAEDPADNPPQDPVGNPSEDPADSPSQDPAENPQEDPAGNPPDDSSPPGNGVDLSNGDDDSPTATESLSLQGPFIKDTTRGEGPPSVPRDLTLLLSSTDWLRFTWAPSADDQSVEAYEIYRDGELLYTVRGDTNFEFDYRSWLSTAYIDCDYTHYTHCSGKQPLSGNSYAYTVVAVDNEGMKSASSEPAVFTLQHNQNSSVDLAQYQMVFADEFDGEQLDRERWKTRLPWGADVTVNSEQQYFVNLHGANPPAYNPFVLTGDTLAITGIRTPDELLSRVNDKPYLSGVLSTRDKFSMTYGYVEMNAKLAGGRGLLSTFFLFNQDFERNKPEVDAIEYIGDRPEKAYHAYHYYDSNRARYSSGEKHSSPTIETLTGSNLSAGFHKYSVLWEPQLLVFYIDDIEVERMVGPRVSDEAMNIVVQLVMGSSWIGDPDPATLPAVLEIDYIRAWQKK